MLWQRSHSDGAVLALVFLAAKSREHILHCLHKSIHGSLSDFRLAVLQALAVAITGCILALQLLHVAMGDNLLSNILSSV